MLKVQNVHSGGVVPYAAEHVGDLTHRMSEWGFGKKSERGARSFNYGREYVRPKVTSVLRMLKNPYGFQKEHLENMVSNAKGRGVPFEEFKQQVDERLKAYADEHRKLPAYNKPQRLARNAAVAIGEQKWDDATKNLEELEALSRDKKTWRRAMERTRPKRLAKGALKKLGPLGIALSAGGFANEAKAITRSESPVHREYKGGKSILPSKPRVFKLRYNK